VESKANKQIDFSFFSVKLINDEIVHVNITGIDEIDIDSAKKIIDGIGVFCQDKKRPVLVSSDCFAGPTPEARTFLAKADSNPYSSATAYITKTLAEKLLANAFIHFNKPVRPTKMFTSEAKAIEWLTTLFNDLLFFSAFQHLFHVRP
jgi:hypothetical protein